MDIEKLKNIGIWIFKIAFCAVMLHIVYKVVLTQHYFFME